MDEFWTTTVLQMACNEPAVRHALTAISIVFNMSCVRGAAPTDTSLIGKNQLATDEYNKAIRHMVHGTDDHLALLVCMIFVSLEILQQNRLAAIDHCRHGVLIMNSTRTISPWARDKILPTLRRLAAFPYYFGSEPDSFPALSEAFEPNDRFHTLDDALTSIDYWTACAIRLIRRADPYLIPRDCDPSLPEEDFPDPYRGGPLSGTSIPEEMLAEQRMVLERARGWQDSMSDYLSFSAPTLRKEEESWTASLLQMRCLILQVWLTAQYTSGEGQLAFDRHMDSFRQVVALGYEMQAKRKTSAAQRPFERATNPSCRRAEAGRTPSPAQPGFASEMGVLPILFFTTLRCRDLELRLQALALLWDMSTEREGLFRVDSMACTARRFVELEHDIDLTGWRWKDSGDSVREFRNAAFSDGPAAWSHDPLEAVPERMRLWDALDPILMRAVLKKGSGGLTKEQAPARGRIVRFIRYDDGKLQSWEESLPISV